MRSESFIRVSLCAIFLGSSLFLQGCDLFKNSFFRSSPGTVLRAQKLNRDETLIVGIFEEPEARTEATLLDWNLANDIVTKTIAANTMIGLTALDMGTTAIKVLPSAAKKWTVTDGGTRYVFNLEEGRNWSDGVPLEAIHFAYAIERVLKPENHSTCRPLLSKVKQVKVVDESTLELILSEPQAYFPGIFAHTCLFPARQDLIEKYQSRWTDPANLVTLGPFKLTDYKQGRFLILRRTKGGVENGIRNIVCYLNLKGSESQKLFESGQLDALANVRGTNLKYFQGRSELVQSPLLDIVFLTFDVKKKPLMNPIFRRAIGMVIDRQEVIRSVGGGQEPIGEMIPPGLLGYESNRGVRFDSDAAAQLLQHSGYKNLEGMRLNLEVPEETAEQTNAQETVVAENIQGQLKRNLGLDVHIVQGNRGKKDIPTIFISRWRSEIADPDSFLGVFKGGSPANKAGWKNRNYDDLIKKAAASEDAETRERLYAKAQHILNDVEMPMIPLYAETNHFIIHRNIHDFPVNILRFMPFGAVASE